MERRPVQIRSRGPRSKPTACATRKALEVDTPVVSESGNLRLVRLGFEAFQREGPGALSALAALADPEIECYAAPGVEPQGWYRGREAVLRWAEEWFEVWEEFHMEPTDFIEVTDEIILVALHQVARGKGSGVEVETDITYLFEIRDGRISRFHLYPETPQAFAAGERLAAGR